MLKTLFTVVFIYAVYMCGAQVKIGYNPGVINKAAVLELSNNTAAAPTTWKSFIPPQVNFSNAVFTTNYIWGIAGTPVAGAIVYNIGESYNNGFSGPGLYCWQRNSWAPINVLVTDRIRMSLSTSTAAYDAATVNSWVNVTAAEYNNLIDLVNGSAKYGIPEIYMNTSASGGWSPDYTVGGNNNAAKVPASSYIIAWSVRTGNGVSSSLNSKLKVGILQDSGYSDYGNPLPYIGDIASNTRVFFALKTPYTVTPATPAYTAVYNSATIFLGNNTITGSGPERYHSGDSPVLTSSFPSDSFSQVISTTIRQW
jgi:hypothetical protein